ncbi:MAG: hypothetical protein AAF764_00725 [Pseudomonadota bacterium]
MSGAAHAQVDALKACAVAALWDTARFDTLEISHVLDLPEATVVRVLDLRRAANTAGGGGAGHKPKLEIVP